MILKYSFIPLHEQVLDRLKTAGKVWSYYFRHQLPHAEALKKTAAFKNKHKGQAAFVLGCGPSLNKLDLRKLAKYQKEDQFKVYAVNSYLLSEYTQELVPDYYFLSDPALFGHKTDYGQAYDDKAQDLVRRVSEKIKVLSLPVFIPADFYDKVDWPTKYPFCDQQDLYSKNIIDPIRPRGYLSATVLKALTMALFMGHEKIYIAGIDCSDIKYTFVNKKNEMHLDYRHFFNDNHNPLRISYAANMCEMLYWEHLLYESYRRFWEYPIINLDPDGLLDCFSKEHELDIYKVN